MFDDMHWREQGDKGELSAMYWLVEQGWHVYMPFGHSPDADLIVDRGDDLIRVQVKTSQCIDRGRWNLTLCTRGGNQSWNRIVKKFSASRCDWLFAHVADGRRWFIPATAIDAGTAIRLGGPKYAAYEVSAGTPLPAAQTV